VTGVQTCALPIYLRSDPSLANSDPMGKGWFFKVHVSNLAQFEELMDPPGYDALLAKL
jgi:glycine cleavage system H protein